MAESTLDESTSTPFLPNNYRFEFQGQGGSFFLIFLKNILLTLVTLGVYLAWAKTERRKYVWNNMTFHKEHFRYTGTGKELFKGYLIVTSAYSLFFILPAIARSASEDAGTFVEVAMGIGVAFAIPFLIYRSRGFLLNRTVFRSIRFGLLPRSKEYAKEFWRGIFLSILTLGTYMPISKNRLHRILTDSTLYGTLEFHYTGNDREALRIGVKGVSLTLLTFGFYYFWYRAELTRYQLAHTHIGGSATFRSEITGGDLFYLFILSTFGTAFTLGLAFPWITMHTLRVIASRTSVEGVIEFDSIEQLDRESGATADGFADALDLDLGF